MSTSRRPVRVAFTALCSTLALGWNAHATPPIVAAARLLSPAAQRQILGAGPRVDTLLVRPGGAITFTTMPVSALDAMRGDIGEVSAGAMRFPLLDRSTVHLGAVAVRQRFELGGRGVAIGVVDTGLDVRHADVRNADGTSRVAWLLDLSRPVRGVHPEIESRFALERDDGVRVGAVYDARDLNQLLAAETRTGTRSNELPTDDVGHGTYVTSIAAGNGRATGNGEPAGRYVGVAPEATIIAVRAVATDAVVFTDAAIVAGASFIIERAAQLGQPVVVNLSAGSHFGSHDGTSPLERALASLVPADIPGRAIVVAAGNDGTDPVHARLDTSRAQIGELPVDIAAAPADDVVSIEVVYEGSASLAVRFANGMTTAFVPPQSSRGFGIGEAAASIANATDEEPADPSAQTLTPNARVHTAAVIITGDPQGNAERAAGQYTVLVRGEGVVHAYISNGGRARPDAQFAGPALSYGTVVVPATSPALVSVGATVTRLTWTTLGGRMVGATTSGSFAMLAPGDLAPFSARGPNRLNAPQPELLAPGLFIVAAMSAQASPDQPLSVFRDPIGSTRNLFVAEDGVHASSLGTSAASPHVAGAMAVMLQARPSATQAELRIALAASARGIAHGSRARWNVDEGWGDVALDRAVDLLMNSGAAGEVDTGRSEFTTTNNAVGVDEPLTLTVRLVDRDGAPVIAEHAVRIDADHGAILAPSAAIGGGRYAMRWRAAGLAAGDVATFTASVDGRALATNTTVRVFRSVANGDAGYETQRGGCTVAPERSSEQSATQRRALSLLVVLSCASVTSRRTRRAPKREP